MGGSDDEKDEWREWRGERESGGRTALDFNVCPGGCGQSPHDGLYDKLFHIHWPIAYLCDLGTSCG
ncbi:hypothetical protein K0M31_010659 [Melipona bicolor]|uniref:Uncharacterized protein n=1 Tax=Melipona bicolor TaxID=60889 RepID=A0AA40FLP2_9HYME|nr:hypothetical protein K0M31_010659 [Melipona bicolor]